MYVHGQMMCMRGGRTKSIQVHRRLAIRVFSCAALPKRNIYSGERHGTNKELKAVHSGEDAETSFNSPCQDWWPDCLNSMWVATGWRPARSWLAGPTECRDSFD